MINNTDLAQPQPNPAPETESKTPENPRRRGGQPGNRNAVTHGFYARPLPDEREESLSQAEEIQGLDEEIALLRSKIRQLEFLDPDNIKLMVQAINTLSNVVIRRRYVVVKDHNGIVNALKELLNGVVVPVAAAKEFLEG
ncbi:MAG: hypothetical protein P3T54_05955 [Dehalogenimonas sp.]|jgi:hypothetical protein|uniref:Uncharacterized protein n=1 Tax=Candidatus Dehalogenimonas loeffleri TaxID=3127115 RepID=A0ABZ2J9C5_9CHLR|nr:hypothetical protein [Dehalogenimonas sp.]